MKTLIYLLFILPVVAFGQNDLNYEFVTGSNASILSADSSLITLHLPTRVIKEHNSIVIVSNNDPGNVRFKSDVQFVGREAGTGGLTYVTSDMTTLYVWPLDGVVEIKQGEKTIAKYGEVIFQFNK